MELASLSPQQMEKLTYLKTSLPLFAERCLKIITKDGQKVPFKFNKAQLYLHKRLEAQKQRLGRVRAVILKGRQEGCTTYVQSRYFHNNLWNSNRSAYILSHQAESTLKIFGMAKRFYDNLPPAIQFPLIKDTEKSMSIENGSTYTVGTAGSAQIGRGLTVQYFHGSEVGFFENADELSTGLMQTVADMAGTEMILESTANGPGNFFYDLVNIAISGKTDFELIFIPWYWMDEYTAPEMNLQEHDLDEDEQKYYEAHKADGLTLAHLAWRRKKIASPEFAGKVWKFQQEYPFTPQEAFIKAEGRFFNIAKLYMAKVRKAKDNPNAPLVIGVDQGRTGDSTEISRRRGDRLLPFETIPADDGKERDMRLAGRLASIIVNENPDMLFVDVTNEHGAVDRLHELGFKKQVRGIHFGEKATDQLRYRNKRTEMHFNFRDWIDEDDKEIPDDQTFLSECAAVPVEKETSSSLKILESKDTIKKELGWSPNKLDAAILTFAYPVKKKNPETRNMPQGQRTQAKSAGWHSNLSSLKGVR